MSQKITPFLWFDDKAEEAASFYVSIFKDAKIDNISRYGEGGEKLQCGWLRDKYGFSWNIVPTGLSDVLGGPDPIKAQRAMQAMLQMEKLDIDALRKAYDGN